jgi:hypothetical protein
MKIPVGVGLKNLGRDKVRFKKLVYSPFRETDKIYLILW